MRIYLKLSLFLLLPFIGFTQNYSIEVSSSIACEGEVILITAKGCDSKVLWQNNRIGKSIVDTVYSDQSYSFTCRNSVTNALIGGSMASTVKVNAKPRTPLLFCNEDEIKAGKQAKIEVLGCENDVIWNTGATAKELIVRPMNTSTYTAKCVSEFGCESDPISRTIIVLNDDTTEGPIVTLKSACLGESLLLKAGGCTLGEYIWYKNEILDKKQGFTAKEIGKGYEINIDEGGDQVFYTARCLFNECLGNESNRMFVFFDERLPSIDLPRKVYLDEGETIDLNSLLPKPTVIGNSFEFRSGKSSSSSLLTDVSQINTATSIFVSEVSKDGKCTSPVAKISIVVKTGSSLQQVKEQLSSDQQELKPESKTEESGVQPFLTQQSTAIGAVISSEKINDELIGITVSQGFSPNNDGINDVFSIENNIGEVLNLRIYNRYGHLVYENEDYHNTWDGKSNTGVAMNNKIGVPDDTYYYVLRLNDGRQKISFLTLKR